MSIEVAAPSWVDAGANSIQGLDLLGLRAPAQVIGTSLLNGVTTISRTVRYLGVQAWTIHSYGEAGLPDSWDSFRDYGMKIESAVALGNLLLNPGAAGVVGYTRAHSLLEEESDPIPLERLVAQLALFIFSSPCQELMLTYPRDSGVPGLSKELGLPLAEEIRGRACTTEFARRLRQDPELENVPREVLREFGEVFRVDVIPDSERDLLLQAILPPRLTETSSFQEKSRLSTYSLLLQKAKDQQRLPKQEDFFLEGSLSTSSVSDVYEDVLDGWLRYQVRDVIAVTHERAFETIFNFLPVNEPFESQVAVQECISALSAEIDDSFRAIGILDTDESFQSIRFSEMEGRVRLLTQETSVRSGLRRWEGELNEQGLIEEAFRSAGSALAVLPITWILTSRRTEPGFLAGDKTVEVLSKQGWARIGLAQVVNPTLERWRRGNPQLPLVIAEMLTRTIDQHLRIAWSRLSQDPQRDVAVITSDGNLWQRREEKHFFAGQTAARLNESVGWLQQLGLFDKDGITELGLEYLNRTIESLRQVKEVGVS